MQTQITYCYKRHWLLVSSILLLTICLGLLPIFSAKSVAKLIDHPCNYNFGCYLSILLGQTILLRTQEFLMRTLHANTLPKIRFYLKKLYPYKNLVIQGNINKIATFTSNIWPLCFIIKSLALIISTSCVVIIQSFDFIVLWMILLSSNFAIIIIWQPNTKDITKRTHLINNKFNAIIKPNTKRIRNACILANKLTNNIIYKKQSIKTILVSIILIITSYYHWQLFQEQQISIGKTLMLLQLNIGVSEIIWWLQHEICNFKVEWQNYNAAKKSLLTTNLTAT